MQPNKLLSTSSQPTASACCCQAAAAAVTTAIIVDCAMWRVNCLPCNSTWRQWHCQHGRRVYNPPSLTDAVRPILLPCCCRLSGMLLRCLSPASAAWVASSNKTSCLWSVGTYFAVISSRGVSLPGHSITQLGPLWNGACRRPLVNVVTQISVQAVAVGQHVGPFCTVLLVGAVPRTAAAGRIWKEHVGSAEGLRWLTGLVCMYAM